MVVKVKEKTRGHKEEGKWWEWPISYSSVVEGSPIKWHWAEAWWKHGHKPYRHLGRLGFRPGRGVVVEECLACLQGSEEAGEAELGWVCQMYRATRDIIRHYKDFVSSEMGNLWKVLSREVTQTNWRGAKRKIRWENIIVIWVRND